MGGYRTAQPGHSRAPGILCQSVHHGFRYVPAPRGGLGYRHRHHGRGGRRLPLFHLHRIHLAVDAWRLFDPLHHRCQRLSRLPADQRPARARPEKGGIIRMSLYCAIGNVDTDLSPRQLNDLLVESLAKLGDRKSVLAVPPDQSREHSRAGELTGYVYKHYGDRLKAVLPAIGTHTPMRSDQIAHMFPAVPPNLFKVHNWRTDIETLGEVPSAFIREQSEGKLDYAWPAQVNKLFSHGGSDLILSTGKAEPH